jgi:type ISP restriction-modification system protein/N-6 DNA methylase
MLLAYLDRVHAMERRGEAREESFYPCLLELLERYGSFRRRPIEVTLIPRKTEHCLLDFQVRGEGQRIVGYVEAKRPGTDLDAAERSEQVKRYISTFPNLILTNFYQLRLYRHGNEAARVETATPFTIQRLEAGPVLQREPETAALLDRFLDFAAPPHTRADSLAVDLAGRAGVLKARIEQILSRDKEEVSELAGLYRAFKEHLVAGLDRGEFADLYAQTIAYGLLAARSRASGRFDRGTVDRHIPATNGILRQVFRYVSLATTPPEIAWIVDDIVDLLAATPVRRMFDRYFHGGRGRDPVLHFYERFLHRYDPALRKRRGVYYTPPEVVSYVVRSVQRLLQTRFGKRDGLADGAVTLLDPAAGTLTFVVEAIRCAVEAVRAEVGDGGVTPLLRDHVLRDFCAFELMMAPYAIGHLKIGLILDEMGNPLANDERVQLYLTNALEMEDLKQSSFPGMAALSRESHAAAVIKKERRITVILGNPPWSGHSANRGETIADLTRAGYVAADGRRDGGYYRLDGEPLGEKNPKWLQDDYVKFLRFAQRKIDEAGEGIVAFVTNHSYLDNPTFRGMRQSLRGTFDEIYLLDLHGNSKKREQAPGGSPDDNVFEGIRQGAAVAFFVKKPGLPQRVLRADLTGSRDAKLGWLAGHDVETTGWTEIEAGGPVFLFAPRDAALEEEYRQGVQLTEIFLEGSVGIVTGRDGFAIDTDPAALRRRIRSLRGSSRKEDVAEAPKETPTWKLDDAMSEARADEDWEERVLPILCRPFDWREIFYADYVVERPRERVMRHMLVEKRKNVGLIVPRQCKEEPGALVTDVLIAHKAVSAYDINTLFPLYVYPREGRLDRPPRAANLAPGCLRLFGRRLGQQPSPEVLLQYVYAVLYSPAYRRRYADLLRADFPRIPLPCDKGFFLELAGFGAVLIDLHLLRRDTLDRPVVRFEGEGSGKVAARRTYHQAERRIVINGEGQRFEGIPPEVWGYRIGGYQVLDRWLAARAKRALRLEEIEELRRIAAALRETIAVQRRIDEVWNRHLSTG